MSRPARAYAHARMRSIKARLLDRAGALPLLCATDERSTDHALSTFGVDPYGELFPQLFARLLPVYRVALRVHRGDESIFRAFLRLHAIENVKIEWREAAARRDSGAPAGRENGHRRDLQELDETLDVESLRDAGELALDRWGTRQLLDAAESLDPLARALVDTVVRERDVEVMRRGPKFYGISEAAARAMTVLQREPANVETLRRTRRRLCRRAFIGHTFDLAPSLAVVLLAEEELRGLIALAERRGESALDGATARALTASLMGEGA